MIESQKIESRRFDELYNSLCIDGQLIHVGLLLNRAFKMAPDRTAIFCDDEAISYKELYSRCIAFAKLLKNRNVTKNDVVIIFYENSIDFVIAYFGIWLIGAVVAPLNVFLTSSEFLHIVSDATPKAIVISDNIFQKLNDIDLNKLPNIITTQDIKSTGINNDSNIDLKMKMSFTAPPDRANASQNSDREITRIGAINSTSTLDNGLEFEIPNKNIDDMAALLYTSGTTGFPKGVMLSSRNIIINALQAISRLETQNIHFKIYCALPLFHSLPQNTCLWSNIILAGTSIIVPKIDRRSILKGLEHKPDIIVAVPALYGLFCMMKTIDFSKVKYFVSGGDALGDKIRSAFSLLYRRKICNGYGLTETSPFICVDLDDYTQQTNTVGRPFIGIDCQIRDENGPLLTHSEIGELWVKGENIMLGYYNAPQATQNIIKDGWLCTGDLAYIDKNGKIVLAGRQRDLIIQKGVKIYPQEVENILLTFPNILQAAVIGIKQNDGEIPIAFVATKDNYPNMEKDLHEFCTRHLAFYKIPRQFIIKKELPVTSTGKVDKKLLKQEYET